MEPANKAARNSLREREKLTDGSTLNECMDGAFPIRKKGGSKRR